MEETKIKGLKIIFISDLMTIKNSYQIKSIDKMKQILTEALEKNETYSTKRKIKSLLREWIAHNVLYKLHLFRSHTKDTDFERNILKRTSFCYFILSLLPLCLYNIKKIKNKIIKRIQSYRYKKYIINHKKNIKKAYKELKNNQNFFLIGDKELLDKLYKRVLKHDDSKFSKEEFEPYRKNFYPINNKEKEDNKNDFNKAWEHHLKNNSHHWQNRQYKENFNIKEDEEVLDVLENILDWMAMGYKFKNRPYQYYEEHKDEIILNATEKIFLEHLIYDIIDTNYINKEK